MSGAMDIPKDWRKVENLFLDFPGYNCFACAPSHPHGFRLQFYRDPGQEHIVAPIPAAGPDRAGFPGILHGGFQSMLLDEIMCWAALHLAGKIVFTASLGVRLKSAVPVDRPLVARGWIEKNGGRLIRAAGRIEADGNVLAEGEGGFFVPTAAGFAKAMGLERAPEKFLPYLRA